MDELAYYHEQDLASTTTSTTNNNNIRNNNSTKMAKDYNIQSHQNTIRSNKSSNQSNNFGEGEKRNKIIKNNNNNNNNNNTGALSSQQQDSSHLPSQSSQQLSSPLINNNNNNNNIENFYNNNAQRYQQQAELAATGSMKSEADLNGRIGPNGKILPTYSQLYQRGQSTFNLNQTPTPYVDTKAYLKYDNNWSVGGGSHSPTQVRPIISNQYQPPHQIMQQQQLPFANMSNSNPKQASQAAASVVSSQYFASNKSLGQQDAAAAAAAKNYFNLHSLIDPGNKRITQPYQQSLLNNITLQQQQLKNSSSSSQSSNVSNNNLNKRLVSASFSHQQARSKSLDAHMFIDAIQGKNKFFLFIFLFKYILLFLSMHMIFRMFRVHFFSFLLHNLKSLYVNYFFLIYILLNSYF